MTLLTRIIHEGLFCNRRYENQNSLRYSFFAPGIIQRALDLASAVATHLTAGGLAARSTYYFKYASIPHGSARLSRLPSRRFRHEPP